MKANASVKRSLQTGVVRSRQKHELEGIRKNKKDNVIKRIRYFSENDASLAQFHSSMSSIDEIRYYLASENVDQSQVAISHLRNLLSSNEDELNLSCDMIALVAILLDSSSEQLQFDSLCCLTYIAAGNHENTQEVNKHYSKICNLLLPHNSANIREQACWVIGNLFGDDNCRDCVDYAAGIGLILSYLNDQSINCDGLSISDIETLFRRQKVAGWALCNSIRGNTPGNTLLSHGCINQLVGFLNHSSNEVAVEFVWIFAFLSAKDDVSIEILLQYGLVEGLMSMLSRFHAGGEDMTVVIPTLRSIGNILASSEELSILILKSHPTFISMISSVANATSYPHVFKEITWVLRSLVQQTDLSFLLTQSSVSEIVDNLLRFLSQGNCSKLRYDCLFILERIWSNDNAILGKCLNDGTVDMLIKYLGIIDSEVQFLCLKILDIIVKISPLWFEACCGLGLLDALDDLQYGVSEDWVRMKAQAQADVYYYRMESNEEDGGGESEAMLYAFGAAEHFIEEADIPECFTEENTVNIFDKPATGRRMKSVKPAWMTEN